MTMTLNQLVNSGKDTNINEFINLIIGMLPSVVNTYTSLENLQIYTQSLVTPFLQCNVYSINNSFSLSELTTHYAYVFFNAITENLNSFLMYVLKNEQINQMLSMMKNQITQQQKHTTAQKQNEQENINRNYTEKQTETQNTQEQNQNLNSESFNPITDGGTAEYSIASLNVGKDGAIPMSEGNFNSQIASFNQNSDSTNKQFNQQMEYTKTENENKNLSKTNDINFTTQQLDFTQINALQQDLHNYLKPILLKIAKSFQMLYSDTDFKGIYWM